MKSELAGNVTIPWTVVQEISSEEILYLTLNDQQVLAGAVKNVDGKVAVRTRKAGEVIVSRDAIEALRSEQEQTAYQAELERLGNPRSR